MRIRPGLIVSFALTLASVAHAADAAKDPSGPGALPPPANVQEFLNKLHHSNRTEIELAALAAKKQVPNEVKEYAQMISQDHTQAESQATKIAQAQKLSIGEAKPSGEVEQKLMRMQQSTREALQALDGRPFAQQYLGAMVVEHDRDIAFLDASKRKFTDDKDIQRLSDELLPKLRQHRERAHKLLGDMARSS